MRPPGRSYATTQAAKTTLFAAGNEADVRKKRRRRLFSNGLSLCAFEEELHLVPIRAGQLELVAAIEREEILAIHVSAQALHPAQVHELTSALQRAAREVQQPPLLIGVDQEGGTLMAVPGTTRFPGNLALGAARSPELAQRAGLSQGYIAKLEPPTRAGQYKASHQTNPSLAVLTKLAEGLGMTVEHLLRVVRGSLRGRPQT